MRPCPKEMTHFENLISMTGEKNKPFSQKLLEAVGFLFESVLKGFAFPERIA
jgi:hypothetical protein